MTRDYANKNKSKSNRKSGGGRANSKKTTTKKAPAKKTQARKKPANKRNASKAQKQGISLPAWAFLLIGLFIGGFISGIYQLATMEVSEEEKNAATQDAPADAKSTKPKSQTQQSQTPKSPEPKASKTKPEPKPKPKPKPVAKSDQPKDYTYYEALKKATIDVPAEQLKPAPKSDIDYYLQTDSFKNRDDAERRRVELIMLNMDAVIHSRVAESGTTWHRVVAGPYKTRSSMSKARSTMADMGIKSVVHKRKTGESY